MKKPKQAMDMSIHVVEQQQSFVCKTSSSSPCAEGSGDGGGCGGCCNWRGGRGGGTGGGWSRLKGRL